MQVKWSRSPAACGCTLAWGVVLVWGAGCADASTPTSAARRARFSLTTTATKVTVTPNPAQALVGDTVAFTATGYDSTGAAVVVTCRWASDDTLVASINPNTGVARAKTGGSSLIKAGCGGVVGAATIAASTSSSTGTVAAVTVSPASVSLAVGGTQQFLATVTDSAGHVLSGQQVTWASSASALATVDSTGLAKAVSAGTATITAAAGGKTGSATLAVSGSAPVWPNDEPSGLTKLLAADGSSEYFFAPAPNVEIGGKWSDATIYAAANNGTRVQVVADPASKYGQAVQKWTFTGETSGFNGFYAWQGSTGFGDGNGYRQLYIRMVFEFGPGWQWDVAHTQKLLYFASNRTNQSGGGSPSSFYVSVDPQQIDFVDQANPNAASTYANGDGSQYDIDYRYNPPTGLISAGSYITVELWIRANSSPTTADGQARLWVNGTEITGKMAALNGAYLGQTGLSNRIWCGDTKFFGTGSAFNANFNNAQTLLYWGGTGDTAATNFFFNLSELYLSGLPG